MPPEQLEQPKCANSKIDSPNALTPITKPEDNALYQGVKQVQELSGMVSSLPKMAIVLSTGIDKLRKADRYSNWQEALVDIPIGSTCAFVDKPNSSVADLPSSESGSKGVTLEKKVESSEEARRMGTAFMYNLPLDYTQDQLEAAEANELKKVNATMDQVQKTLMGHYKQPGGDGYVTEQQVIAAKAKFRELEPKTLGVPENATLAERQAALAAILEGRPVNRQFGDARKAEAILLGVSENATMAERIAAIELKSRQCNAVIFGLRLDYTQEELNAAREARKRGN